MKDCRLLCHGPRLQKGLSPLAASGYGFGDAVDDGAGADAGADEVADAVWVVAAFVGGGYFGGFGDVVDVGLGDEARFIVFVLVW